MQCRPKLNGHTFPENNFYRWERFLPCPVFSVSSSTIEIFKEAPFMKYETYLAFNSAEDSKGKPSSFIC